MVEQELGRLVLGAERAIGVVQWAGENGQRTETKFFCRIRSFRPCFPIYSHRQRYPQQRTLVVLGLGTPLCPFSFFCSADQQPSLPRDRKQRSDRIQGQRTWGRPHQQMIVLRSDCCANVVLSKAVLHQRRQGCEVGNRPNH